MNCERYFLFFKNLLSFGWLLLVENSLVSSLSTIDHLIKAILDGNICINIQSSIVSAEIYQYSLKMMNIQLELWTYRKILTWLCLQSGQCLSVHCWNGWRWTSESRGSRSSLPTHNINKMRKNCNTGHSLYYTCITNNESNSFCSSYLYIAQVKCNYIAQVINLDFSNIIIWSSKSLK